MCHLRLLLSLRRLQVDRGKGDGLGRAFSCDWVVGSIFFSPTKYVLCHRFYTLHAIYIILGGRLALQVKHDSSSFSFSPVSEGGWLLRNDLALVLVGFSSAVTIISSFVWRLRSSFVACTSSPFSFFIDASVEGFCSLVSSGAHVFPSSILSTIVLITLS